MIPPWDQGNSGVMAAPHQHMESLQPMRCSTVRDLVETINQEIMGKSSSYSRLSPAQPYGAPLATASAAGCPFETQTVIPNTLDPLPPLLSDRYSLPDNKTK